MLEHKYVITMPWKEERMKHFRNEMRVMWRDDVEEVYGVDWEKYVEEHGLKLRDGVQVRHIGNFLSHLNILKDALEKWYDEIIVMEDDLILQIYAKAFHPRMLEQCPNDRELLRLSWCYSPAMIARKPINNQWMEDVWPRWTEMYQVRWDWIRKLYEYLLHHTNTIPIDRVIHKAPVKSYMAIYPLGMQRSNYPLDSNK